MSTGLSFDLCSKKELHFFDVCVEENACTLSTSPKARAGALRVLIIRDNWLK